MDENKEKEAQEFYVRLQIELDNTNTWPTDYLFKFIVPSVDDNVSFVENSFNGMGAVIKTTKSKTGKYTSISVDVIVKNSEIIIQKYKEVSLIKGIVSL